VPARTYDESWFDGQMLRLSRIYERDLLV